MEDDKVVNYVSPEDRFRAYEVRKARQQVKTNKKIEKLIAKCCKVLK